MIPVFISIWFNDDLSTLPIIVSTRILMTIFGMNRPCLYIQPPCNISHTLRRIPYQPWYMNKYFNICIVGMILGIIWIIITHFCINNMGSVCGIEEIISMESGHWYLRLTFAMTFFILLFVLWSFISVLTIIMTFIQFNHGDWRWWWRSLFMPGSVAIYSMIYSLLSLECILNDVILTICTFLVISSIGFNASHWFLYKIYERPYCD